MVERYMRELRYVGASVVLITVACIHLVRVTRDDLTQWKGGGFGMFSTVDSGGARQIVVRLNVDGVWYDADLPKNQNQDLRESLYRAKFLPSQGHLARIGEKLAESFWIEPRADASWTESRPASTDQRERDHQEALSRTALYEAAAELRSLSRWHPGDGIHGRLRPLDSVRVEVRALRYDRHSRRMFYETIRSCEAPATDVDVLVQRARLDPTLVRESWMQ